MAKPSANYPLISQPGVKRDGTIYDGNNFTDGQWVRFQRGKPRKIGGYRSISEAFNGPIRGLGSYSIDGNTRFYVGSSNAVEFTDVDTSGVGSGVTNITPASGFVPSDDNLYKFAVLPDLAGTGAKILVHAAPNAHDISSNESRAMWLTDTTGSARLVDSGAPQLSGGVVTAPPYAFVYGNYGYAAWCEPNQPTHWDPATYTEAGNARITQSKLVHAAQTRGGVGASPALLFWSLDAVVRATFDSGAATFGFDTITADTHILSSQGVVEYNGMFFWPGVNGFIMYNGVVQDLVNDMNFNYFYERLNRNAAQKVWGTKVRRFNEIHWHFPAEDSSECNDSIIFNVKENTWYDNTLSRSIGLYPAVFSYPVLASLEQSEIQTVRPLGGTPTATVPAPQTISSITHVTTTATLTTAANHNLATGAAVTVVGATPSAYNVANAIITVTSPTTFTYVMASDPGANASVVGSYTVTSAVLAFDDNPATHCNAGVNGTITYDFGLGASKTINKVGVWPATAGTYDFLFEYSTDSGLTWNTVYDPPSQAYVNTAATYFNLNTPVSAQIFRVSVSGGATLDLTEFYLDQPGWMILQHEFGVDRVVGNKASAIQSYFETADVAWAADGPVAAGTGWVGEDRWILCYELEPDMIQSGDMTITISTRRYTRSDEYDQSPFIIGEDTEVVYPQIQGRLMRFRFESNVLGGDYQLGQVMVKFGEGDGRQ